MRMRLPAARESMTRTMNRRLLDASIKLGISRGQMKIGGALTLGICIGFGIGRFSLDINNMQSIETSFAESNAPIVTELEADVLQGDISKHGIWNSHHNGTDPSVGQALLDFFQQENAQHLADFGCGRGQYAMRFNDSGIKTQCFDGTELTPNYTNGRCQVLDLAQHIEFPEPFDWILSLEVGEHIPAEYEDEFFGNLHRNNKHGIVLSYAIEGQDGTGHVNEHNNEQAGLRQRRGR